jgi:hypothetical protein
MKAQVEFNTIHAPDATLKTSNPTHSVQFRVCQTELDAPFSVQCPPKGVHPLKAEKTFENRASPRFPFLSKPFLSNKHWRHSHDSRIHDRADEE